MRYAVQRYGTWEWLDREAFIMTNDGPEWARNAYGIMRAHVPSPAARPAHDGRDMFEEWGTLVHFEIDDPGRTRREWTGMVSEATLGRAGWDLTLVEHPAYLKGTPFEGLIRGVKDDPADMLRQLVADVQAWRNAWYGCTVEGTTPVRVGTDLDDRIAAARAAMDARRKTLDAFSKTSKSKTKELQDADSTLADDVAQARALVTQAQALVTELIGTNAESAQIALARQTLTQRLAEYRQALAGYNTEIAAGRSALANARKTKESAQTAYDAAKKAYDTLKQQRNDGEGAYVIDGDELPDAYGVLQDLCRTAGIEWTTRTRYSEGAPDVSILIHYPTAGARRRDLVFDTGVNITAPLELDRLPYFNAAAGRGAGEGQTAIRRNTSVPTDRMRRTAVVEDKAAKKNAQIDAQMRAKLRASTGAMFPRAIEVRDHPNARIGSWRPGDIITISGVTTIGTRWKGLARIESWSWPSRNRALLQLEPA